MQTALPGDESVNPFANGYIHFRLGKPHRGYIGLVSRGVSVYPAAHFRPGMDLKTVRGYAHSVILQYRAVLTSLVMAGKLSAAKAHLLGNCRPTGFHVKPHVHVCAFASLCPSCAARRAVEFWLQVDRALFPPLQGGKRGARAVCDLVYATRHIGPADVRVYEGKLKGVLDERLADRWDGGPQLLGSRSLEKRRLKRGFIWMIEGLVVDVSCRESRLWGWTVAVRQLFAVPTGAEFEVPGSVTTRVVSPTRRQVARAVVKLCRYPRGLLVAGNGQPTPAGVVAKYLTATRRRRLWAVCKGKAILPAGVGEIA
jgi:hypothetical protein